MMMIRLDHKSTLYSQSDLCGLETLARLPTTLVHVKNVYRDEFVHEYDSLHNERLSLRKQIKNSLRTAF